MISNIGWLAGYTKKEDSRSYKSNSLRNTRNKNKEFCLYTSQTKLNLCIFELLSKLICCFKIDIYSLVVFRVEDKNKIIFFSSTSYHKCSITYLANCEPFDRLQLIKTSIFFIRLASPPLLLSSAIGQTPLCGKAITVDEKTVHV